MSYLEEAVDEAYNGLEHNLGGPFGAVIVKDGEVISRGCNMVLCDHDPTAHAEVTAIRRACQKLNTHDLSGCVIYSSSEPCPMCLSAIIWANIKDVYFGTDRVEVAEIGFRDEHIYNYIKKPDNTLNVVHLDSKKCQKLLKDYKDVIY